MVEICELCNHPFNSEYHMSDECIPDLEYKAEAAMERQMEEGELYVD